MTHKTIVNVMLVVVLGISGIATTEAESILVFKDGSSIEVTSATLERGAVVVELANGRKQQFDKHDIDLESSGLTPTTAAATTQPQPRKSVPKLVMPGDKTETSGLTITDQDVGHVTPGSKTRSENEEETGDQNEALDSVPLRISGVRQREHDGGVTVTGTVTNDGIFDLEETTVAGVALDADGKNLGQGSVGLASTLGQGSSRDFSLMIPVTGEIDTVKVSASASEIRPTNPISEESENQRPSEEGNSRTGPADDETSGDSAG